MTISQTPRSAPDHFILPDLVSHCKFPLSVQPNALAVAADSDRWLDQGCPELSPEKRHAVYTLQAGILTAQCYPHCDDEHMRVVADFLVYLFHLDNMTDVMVAAGTEQLADLVMNAHWFPNRYIPTHAKDKEQPDEEPSAGKLARDYWSRCIKDAKPGPQARFKQNLDLFFSAVQIQAANRSAGIVPDIESYIIDRRDTSGCRPAFDLIEYSMGIDLPEYVLEDPVIVALSNASNDLVAWSNDLFSYNVEQARGDEAHNMITIVMQYQGVGLQEAVDYVGELCRQTINGFAENLEHIPSWGPEIDRDVKIYVKGLQDWIVGSLHWSFITHRYFGPLGPEIKKTRYVKLHPKKKPEAST
ncbi:terpenoid synthase [Daedalea quercina L-15889]|uniref:Terpene synthase n=1 Tax=Daedalea quercina L-15889 TaxID=1314783 RepID=A0A165QRE4_9APHY|nr:terpenoid synthase [Daedalea quercina L-15889]